MKSVKSRKSRKGQAAIEFLSTYSWAIIGVLVGIGALTYFDIMDVSKLATEVCNTGAQFKCTEAEAVAGTGQTKIVFQNDFGYDMVVDNLTLVVDGQSYSDVPAVNYLPKGQNTLLSGPVVSGGSLNPGATKQADVYITFRKRGDTRDYTTKGTMIIKARGTAEATASTCNNDGTCSGAETAQNCPDDCVPKPVCNDGICDTGESSACPADCTPPDPFPPFVNVTVSAGNPSATQMVTLTATASDPSGIEYTVIYVDGLPEQGTPCPHDVTTCTTTPHAYSSGWHYYYAEAADKFFNVGRDPQDILYKSFQVQAPDLIPPIINSMIFSPILAQIDAQHVVVWQNTPPVTVSVSAQDNKQVTRIDVYQGGYPGTVFSCDYSATEDPNPPPCTGTVHNDNPGDQFIWTFVNDGTTSVRYPPVGNSYVMSVVRCGDGLCQQGEDGCSCPVDCGVCIA